MRSPPIIIKVWTSQVADLIDRLKRIDSAEHLSVPYFVFKIDEQLKQNLSNDAISRRQIVQRYPNKKTYLLVYDRPTAKHNVYLVQEGDMPPVADEQMVSSIRQFDLVELITGSNRDCLIHAPPGSHFVTPSRKHTTKFLRLADALHSLGALDSLSYWLQAEMKGAAAVIIDTWSLASVVLASQLSLGADGVVPFDCFERHIRNDEEEAEQVVSRLASKISKEGPLLCLVSVSSSGSFFEILERIVRKSNITNPIRMLSIYKFRDTAQEIESLATLDFDLEWYDESNCVYCSGGENAKTYEIDPKFYYPRQHKEKVLRVRKSLLEVEKSASESSAPWLMRKFTQARRRFFGGGDTQRDQAHLALSISTEWFPVCCAFTEMTQMTARFRVIMHFTWTSRLYWG
jgi:hypothetical protein